MEFFRKLFGLAPKSFDDYCRGVAQFEKGQWDQAIAILTKSIGADPEYPNAYYYRGMAREQLGRHDEAIADFSQVIRITPGNSGAYNDRGYCYFCKGDIDHALADHTRAIELDPKLALAWSGRGVARGRGAMTRGVADPSRLGWGLRR